MDNKLIKDFLFNEENFFEKRLVFDGETPDAPSEGEEITQPAVTPEARRENLAEHVEETSQTKAKLAALRTQIEGGGDVVSALKEGLSQEERVEITQVITKLNQVSYSDPSPENFNFLDGNFQDQLMASIQTKVESLFSGDEDKAKLKNALVLILKAGGSEEVDVSNGEEIDFFAGLMSFSALQNLTQEYGKYKDLVEKLNSDADNSNNVEAGDVAFDLSFNNLSASSTFAKLQELKAADNAANSENPDANPTQDGNPNSPESEGETPLDADQQAQLERLKNSSFAPVIAFLAADERFPNETPDQTLERVVRGKAGMLAMFAAGFFGAGGAAGKMFDSVLKFFGKVKPDVARTISEARTNVLDGEDNSAEENPQANPAENQATNESARRVNLSEGLADLINPNLRRQTLSENLILNQPLKETSGNGTALFTLDLSNVSPQLIAYVKGNFQYSVDKNFENTDQIKSAQNGIALPDNVSTVYIRGEIPQNTVLPKGLVISAETVSDNSPAANA